MNSSSGIARYTGIWQADAPIEKEWIEEVFGALLKDQVTDGKHELVLEDSILFDAFVYCNDLDYYRKFRGKNAFLVHFLDENFEGLYEEIYSNFKGVFRCHWSDVFNPNIVRKFPIGYTVGMSRAGREIVPATEREYLWSFVGQISKASRPDMARELLTVQPHFLYSPEDVHGYTFLNKIDGKPKRLPPEEFSRILLQSTFSPCPMGNVQVECFRLYESLECGAIPIVEKRMTLDYFRELFGEHPIPSVRSWKEARHFIRDLTMRPEEIDRLQQTILEWWDIYKKTYIADVEAFILARAEETQPLKEQVMMPKYSRPGWRMIELARHHDTRAMVRRIGKQISRLAKTGKSREAFRPK